MTAIAPTIPVFRPLEPTPAAPACRRLAGLLAYCLHKILDGRRRAWQNCPIAFNQAIRFDSLYSSASKPPQSARALQTPEYPSGISYACNPPILPFYGKRGRKALRLLVTNCQSVNPSFVSRPAFDSAKAGLLNQFVKADSMNPTASIGVSVRRSRAGYARPLTVQPLRTFPTVTQAGIYISKRLKHRPAYRFNIQQTAADTWTVCRVISGGVA